MVKTAFPHESNCKKNHIKAKMLANKFSLGGTHELPARLSNECKIGSYFDQERPKYSKAFLNVPDIKLGKRVKALDLLGDSRNALVSYYGSGMGAGVMASGQQSLTLDISGKYVMICCVFVPSIWSSKDADMVYHTTLAYHELARRDDFVLVVVPMMRKGFCCSYDAYEIFLSAFSCLVVRLVDSQRECICSALGFNGKIKVLILDLAHNVFFHGPRCFSDLEEVSMIAFPLLRKDKLSVQVMTLFWRLASSMNFWALYNIEYHHQNVPRISSTLEEGRLSITIAQLRRKVVGLYVCSDCRSLCKLVEVYYGRILKD